MDAKNINNKYWVNVPWGEIIGDNAIPSEELFSVISENASILDVGCGRGEWLQRSR